jgi:hypothetical protein
VLTTAAWSVTSTFAFATICAWLVDPWLARRRHRRPYNTLNLLAAGAFTAHLVIPVTAWRKGDIDPIDIVLAAAHLVLIATFLTLWRWGRPPRPQHARKVPA